MSVIDDKIFKLKSILKNYKSVVIGFSGGLDSTFLAKVAYDVLGEKAFAVTFETPLTPKKEIEDSICFAKVIKIKHRIENIKEINWLEENPKNRCYLCKKDLFTRLKKLASDEGYNVVIDGTNTSDIGNYRPGMQALKELSVKSPLLEAGFSKSDIREMSKKMGLASYDAPSSTCLASRFEYNTKIDKNILESLDKAEQILRENGFFNVRIRLHGDIGRIEVDKNKISILFQRDFNKIISNIKEKLKLRYLCVDLEGFRTGSMDE